MIHHDERMYFRDRKALETALLTWGVEEDAVVSFLTLADTYGAVHVPVFQVTEDAWGRHESLTLQKSGATGGWDVVFKVHVGY